jgi:hypothetical protein
LPGGLSATVCLTLILKPAGLEIMNIKLFSFKKSTIDKAIGAFMLISALLNSSAIFAQWEPDIRLTNATDISSPSYNNARNIAASGDTVHMVWYDHRSGNYKIYYKRSTDQGLSWGGDVLLTNIPSGSSALYPSIAISGNHVYVVWHSDVSSDSWEVYFNQSTDGGNTWENEIRLTNNFAFSGYPSLAVSGNIIHVTWYDDQDGNYEIYYTRSLDGGLTWETNTRLTNNADYSWSPSIAVSGNFVHLVWFDNSDGNEEIYYIRSTDSGETWEEAVRLTNDPAFSDNVSITASGSLVHIVYQDSREGNYNIYYICLGNNGEDLLTDTRLTFSEGNSYNPFITSSGQNLHCIWYDSRDGNYEIYYKCSTDSGVTWEDDTRLTDDPASSAFPFIAVAGSVLHVMWQDYRDANAEIYYKRNLNGNLVTGIPHHSTDPLKALSVGQNYPNPCSSTTKIRFHVAGTGNANITLYDRFGKEAATLLNEKLKPGTYEISFDASGLTNGIYYYCLRMGNKMETKKMIILK